MLLSPRLVTLALTGAAGFGVAAAALFGAKAAPPDLGEPLVVPGPSTPAPSTPTPETVTPTPRPKPVVTSKPVQKPPATVRSTAIGPGRDDDDDHSNRGTNGDGDDEPGGDGDD